jgi:hypothetical protein
MKLLNIIEATKVQEGSNDSYYAYHNAAEKWAKDTGQPKEKFAYAGVDVQDKYIEPEMKKYGLVPDSYQGKGVTKYRRENTEEGFPDYKMMTRGHDHNDKTCPVCKGSGNEKSYDELNNKPGHVYIQKPKPKCPSCDGTGKKIEEGEERSIIADACVEKLVDEFSGRENQFENKEDFEYAIYQALEDLDVEDCVDPDMEVGGQRIGDFASGRVIDCCSSSSIIYDVMANMDETQIGEGIFDKHSYDPVAPGGQSSKRKNLHATGDIVSLDGKEYVVTKVDLDKGTVDVVDRDGKRSPNVKAGVFSPGIKVGDKKSPTIGNFASDNRDPRLFDGKSPHKKGSAKYKKHMAAMHAEAVRGRPKIDGEATEIQKVEIGGVEREFIRKGEMWHSTDPKYPMKYGYQTPMGQKIAKGRKKDLAKSTPSYQAKLKKNKVMASEAVNEAEYNGKDVKLNKPTRQSGGGKKYKVYVKNPKTGRVKKISFGDAGLKTKSGNKKRAKSFAARHNCEKKNDKMKAGYWACRLPRYGLVKGGKWW